MINGIEEVVSETGVEVEAAEREFTGIAGDIMDMVEGIVTVANTMQDLNDGMVASKGEFRKLATKARKDLLPVFEVLKGIRASMLPWKEEAVKDIPGARKSKSKEQIREEIAALQARLTEAE